MSRLRQEAEALGSSKSKHKDYDPEDDFVNEDQDDDQESLESNEADGREHYQKVEKSKIRKPQTISLDPKYSAVAVSRTMLEATESEDDDPFAPQDEQDDEDPFGVPQDDGPLDEDMQIDGAPEELDEDESINSDEAFGSSDDGKFDNFTFRGSKANRLVEINAEEEEFSESVASFASEGIKMGEENISAGSEDSDINDDNEAESEDQDEDSDVSEESPERSSTSRKREDLKAYLSNETKNLASALSQAASSDVKKGTAVKRQYNTYDRLLDARMKLQKAYTSTAQLGQSGTDFTTEAEEALANAKVAALKLYETIHTFRQSINASTTSAQPLKRKRTTSTTDIEDLSLRWLNLQEFETEALLSRRATLEKWSQKIKASDPTQAVSDRRSKFLDSTTDNRLTAILDTYVLNEQDKHFYNANSEGQTDPDNKTSPEIEAGILPPYDDNLFYQSLLRDLITTRAATNSAASIGMVPILPHRLHPSGNRQNKNVRDTKASKGRKIRYTVHEKLQNFMAAEGDTGRDTAMWTERGKDEFFGSLFGQERALAEDEEEDAETGDGQNNSGEIEALRLFRR